MLFILLINVEMPNIVGILTIMSRIKLLVFDGLNLKLPLIQAIHIYEQFNFHAV